MNKTFAHKRSKKIASKNIFSKYCTEEWVIYINLNKTVIEYNPGDFIFKEGDKVKGIFLMEKGKAKVISTFGNNSEHILRLAANGTLLGHRGLGSKTYPVSAIALTPTTTIFIPIDIFERLLKANPNFSLYLINFITAELKESESRMKKMIHLDVRQKIADIIIMLTDAFGFDKKEKGKLAYTLSRYDFANIAGTTYETVIRSLAFLQKKGYIRLDGKIIFVVNPDALRKFCKN